MEELILYLKYYFKLYYIVYWLYLSIFSVPDGTNKVARLGLSLQEPGLDPVACGLMSTNLILPIIPKKQKKIRPWSPHDNCEILSPMRVHVLPTPFVPFSPLRRWKWRKLIEKTEAVFKATVEKVPHKNLF